MSRCFSIIMTVYDQAYELEENLPAFLTQVYEPGYEVIVVDESSTDNTEDVLKLAKNNYPQLYTTFLPRPNRLVSRPKLSFTIGVKAAKNEWIIIADIKKKPAAPNVLQAIENSMSDNAVLYLGYLTGKGLRLQPFDDVTEVHRQIVKAERKKSNGHQGKRMRYIRGKYDFIIVHKDYAHDLLKFFEERPSRLQLLGLRLGILWQNLCKRSSTTLLIIE